MNARRTILLTALLALSVPNAGVAQRGPRGTFGPGGAAQLERWLELGDELDLSADQTARLQEIRARLESENAPHLERIAAVRDELGLPPFRPAERRSGSRGDGDRPAMSDEDRQKMRDFMDRTRDDMRAVADNTRAAMTDARDVLTDEQRATLREKMRADRGRGGGMRPHRGRKPEGGR